MRKLIRIAVAGLWLAAAHSAAADQGGFQPFSQPGGADVPGQVLLCADPETRVATPCGVAASPLNALTAPFQRNGKAFALPVSTTPQTYAIQQPAGALVYRGINPCNVDIVIATVSATAPVTTQPATLGGETIGNVQLVTSATGTANKFQDTLFMARSGRVLGSSVNPMGGQTRYVSIMALTDPGTTPCAFRMHYGSGN
ncbi:hypothetical protein HCU64_06555 [Methylobacterium sp. C25]|uniref:hypothetical protein n=1 Tax=Methylobacterium sp. C25 TaxID=2721622 RepID=UPI001F1BF603|nr:hypothetical protein [Methylobacterium sp. C25]MCE4223407.1 hypothetical protein [Methylobacterium sp. C25]